MSQRQLTEEERIELATLTDAVHAALRARTDWLDAKMVETSELQVGDDIYNLRTGRKVGVVAELYRYWRDRNDLLDDNVGCSYRYETGYVGSRCFDNTSRQYDSFGTREQALVRAEFTAARLRGAS